MNNTNKNTPINKKTFPNLYGYDTNGKQKIWSISAYDKGEHSIVEIGYGYVSGKITRSSKIISTGKNIGKKNETTPYQQAISEAQSKWKKKTETGFSENNNQNIHQNIHQNIDQNIDDEKYDQNINQNIDDEKVIFPMLASEFQKFKKKIVYPTYIQPKLDGYRMIYNSKNNSCNSRQGKSFDAIKNTSLYKELCKIKTNIILDGELYTHGGIFEHLGILRKKTLSESDYKNIEKIEYHVYDYVDEKIPFEKRYQNLKQFIENNSFNYIKLVQTTLVNSEDEIKQTHLSFVNNQYEGSIVRTSLGKYRCKCRSQDLLKFKDFKDSEYTIVDFTSEQDSLTNKQLVLWICENEHKDTFNVRPKGTREERNYLYERAKDFIGQKLHVKYFELTESGIPRFPTTKSESYITYIRNVVE